MFNAKNKTKNNNKINFFACTQICLIDYARFTQIPQFVFSTFIIIVPGYFFINISKLYILQC